MPKKKAQVSRQTRWQRKHREMGLCVVCSEPAYKGWRCVRHYEQHKITMRLRYIPRVRGRYDVGGAAEFLAAADREDERKRKKRSASGKARSQKQTQAEASPNQVASGRSTRGGKARTRAAAAGPGSGATEAAD